MESRFSVGRVVIPFNERILSVISNIQKNEAKIKVDPMGTTLECEPTVLSEINSKLAELLSGCGIANLKFGSRFKMMVDDDSVAKTIFYNKTNINSTEPCRYCLKTKSLFTCDDCAGYYCSVICYETFHKIMKLEDDIKKLYLEKQIQHQDIISIKILKKRRELTILLNGDTEALDGVIKTLEDKLSGQSLDENLNDINDNTVQDEKHVITDEIIHLISFDKFKELMNNPDLGDIIQGIFEHNRLIKKEDGYIVTGSVLQIELNNYKKNRFANL